MSRAEAAASRARGIRARAFLASLLAALWALPALSGCGEDAGGPATGPVPRDCAELSDSLFPASARPGFAVFKVVEPNGGTFKVGSQMTVVVAGADYSNALIDLVLFDKGIIEARIPGLPSAKGIDPRAQCEFTFAVPESISTTGGKRVPLVSDSVKVRISDYSDPQSYDYSDSAFAIVR